MRSVDHAGTETTSSSHRRRFSMSNLSPASMLLKLHISAPHHYSSCFLVPSEGTVARLSGPLLLYLELVTFPHTGLV